METDLEKNERLYRSEVDTLNKLMDKKYELERLIKHQEENVEHRAKYTVNGDDFNWLPRTKELLNVL